MDILKKAAKEFDRLLSTNYYFEIARKNTKKEFLLNFRPEDFHHIAGLHKLIDIGLVQTGTRDRVYRDIVNDNITYSDISISNYFAKIANRIDLVCQMQNILDSNQIVFKYLDKTNQFSRIEADFLLENAHEKDIIYVFLSERKSREQSNYPIMCCRSFFPMEQLDYTRNQPSYTLLKKIKIDTVSEARIVQYDRSAIISRAKNASSESERKSIMQQLNEKKAQAAINNVLSNKVSIQRDKQNRERI